MSAKEIRKVACLGAGVVGSGWATNLLMKGYAVNIYDIGKEQLENSKTRIAASLDYLHSKGILGEEVVARAGELAHFTDDIAEAVRDVQFIQESGPENYHAKQAILALVEEHATPNAIFASSTSGLLISEIARFAKHPERCLGAHPYNPPHLIPLVELSRGDKTSEEALNTAYDFFKLLGKEPVILRKEALGFIANRLSLALYREAVDLVMNGVCSIEDVDKAVCYGPGLRYAALGPNLLYHLGGGPHGVRGILTHIGPSVELWWADMADWKKWPQGWADIAEQGVKEEMANRSPEQGQTTEELARFRDDMISPAIPS